MRRLQEEALLIAHLSQQRVAEYRDHSHLQLSLTNQESLEVQRLWHGDAAHLQRARTLPHCTDRCTLEEGTRSWQWKTGLHSKEKSSRCATGSYPRISTPRTELDCFCFISKTALDRLVIENMISAARLFPCFVCQLLAEKEFAYNSDLQNRW